MRRYADLNPVPENVPFIDRIVCRILKSKL